MDAGCVSSVPPGIGGPEAIVRSVLEIEIGHFRQSSNRTTIRGRERSSTLATEGVIPLANAVVHLKWWGDGDGHFLRPSSKNPADRKVRYAVRCDHRQLETYLRDMQTLPFRIYLSLPPNGIKLLGIAYVDSLDRLPWRKSICGTYPVISVGGAIMATLSIAVRLVNMASVGDSSKRTISTLSPSKIKALPAEPGLTTAKPTVTSSSDVSFDRRFPPRCTSPVASFRVSRLQLDDHRAVQRTLSSLIERGRRLRHDITKLLLKEEEDDDDSQFLSRGNLRNKHSRLYSNSYSVSDVLQSLSEIDTKDRGSSLVRSVEAVIHDQPADATSSSSDADDTISVDRDQLFEDLSVLDERFCESCQESQNVRDGRPMKTGKPLIQIPTKQTSFHNAIAAKKRSVHLPTNGGAQGIRNGAKLAAENINSNVNVFCVLLIPEGNNFVSTQMTAIIRRNRLYLSCRAFWNDSVARSGACWASSSDDSFVFAFRHEGLALFSGFLLERRIKNNVMVVEVWLEDADHGDRLLGTCKLPLKLIYAVFGKANPETIRSRRAMENAVVVAVDDVLPVCELLTGCTVGRLHVLLAVGTDRRRVLQRVGVAPSTYASASLPKVVMSSAGESTGCRHLFEVTVKSVMMTYPPGSNKVWGESNCRVTYRLSDCPTTLPPADGGDAVPSMRNAPEFHHLNWVLCEPLMHWNSTSEHVVDLLPPPVVTCDRDRRNVSPPSAPESIGLGFHFRVYCMHYYPVELIQLVSEVNVPLAELSLLAVKSGVGKMFNLPLHAQKESNSDESDGPTIGMLTVHLRHRYCVPSMMTNSDVVARDHKATNTSAIYPHVGVDTVPTKEAIVESRDHARNEEMEKSALTALKDITCTTETEQTFLVVIVVERAVHLRFADKPPSAYVTLEMLSEKLCTGVVLHDEAPNWNFRATVSLRWDTLWKSTLVFSVYNAKESNNNNNNNNNNNKNSSSSSSNRVDEDQLIGRVSVDLSPLKYGLPLLCGWYNVVDAEARCNGQLKVVVQPTVDVNLFKALKSVTADDEVATVRRHNNDTEGDPSGKGRRFVTSGSYVRFPSHIGQFVEQTICLEPPTTEDRLADIETVDETASRSFLADNLQRRLKELDDILVGRACIQDVLPNNSDGLVLDEVSIPTTNSTLSINVGPASQQQLVPVLDRKSENVSLLEFPSKVRARRCRVAAAIYNGDINQ